MHLHSFDPFPELETERLKLRALCKDDRDIIFKLRTNVQVNRYIMREREKTLKQTEAFITRIMTNVAENKSVYWVITNRESGKLLGTICLWNFAFDAMEAELGYELFPTHQGKGIMHEALQAVTRYAFDVLRLQLLSAYTNKDNASSIRLLERNAFQFAPKRRDGHFADNRVYELRNMPATDTAS